jgi:hypothetical protein
VISGPCRSAFRPKAMMSARRWSDRLCNAHNHWPEASAQPARQDQLPRRWLDPNAAFQIMMPSVFA